MNKQKLISVLQSRIAKRRMLLKTGWNSFADKDYKHDRRFLKFRMIKLGLEQKEDKQILKQLLEDERSIKDWKREFERSLETNRSLEAQIRHVKATGHPLIRGMAN